MTPRIVAFDIRPVIVMTVIHVPTGAGGCIARTEHGYYFGLGLDDEGVIWPLDEMGRLDDPDDPDIRHISLFTSCPNLQESGPDGICRCKLPEVECRRRGHNPHPAWQAQS